MADRMKASSTMIVRSQSQSSQIGENPTLNIKKAPVEKNLERWRKALNEIEFHLYVQI